jgi:hypothetical protein
VGIEWHAARFLVACKKRGVNFEKMITVGRQDLFTPPQQIRDIFEEYGCTARNMGEFLKKTPTFADEFFVQLGAESPEAVDASDYEGANIVHDMNQSVGRELHGKYDVVMDGGSLEHVFNYPVAIKNCMEMVKVGGHLIIQTAMDNFVGHGFYQFSPELFYRILCADNGYQVERMVAFEFYYKAPWYEVADPVKVRGRVELIHGKHRVGLFVLAKRTHEAEVFKKTPQQSDYASTWNASTPRAEALAPVEVTRVPLYLQFQVNEKSPKQRVRRLAERVFPGVMHRFRSRKDEKYCEQYTFERQPGVFTRVDM